MPRHGIVRKKNSILFGIESSPETKKQFPFPFRLDIRYTLTENRILTEYTVHICGKQEMPFQTGGYQEHLALLLADEQENMIDHYDHPIYGCGIRLVDMVYLRRLF